jgi:gas vesicle protein
MKNFRSNRVKDWVRLGAKLSLLFTDPKVRSAINDGFKDHADDLRDHANDLRDRASNFTDAVSSKYDDAADRVQAAADAIRGKRHWAAQVGGFLLGVGVGAGLGILLAPASGAETRDAVRDTAVDMKNRVSSRIRQSVNPIPFTGTEG